MRIYSCSSCGAKFAVDAAPRAGGIACPECGALLGTDEPAGAVIDVAARPVGETEGPAQNRAAPESADAPPDGLAEAAVAETRGRGFYQRTVRGPGGAYRFQMVRGVQGGQGCSTCGCIVVLIVLFLMLRGCMSLF